MLNSDSDEEPDHGGGNVRVQIANGRPEEKPPLKDKIIVRARKAWDHIDRRGGPKVSVKRQNLLLGWTILTALMIVHIGILTQYVHFSASWPRTHGWKALASVLGLDVEDETTNCETRILNMKNESPKQYSRCSPTLYFGFRSFGVFIYFGMYTVFALLSAWFLRSTPSRHSIPFRRFLDNTTFLIGCGTTLDILLVFFILNGELGGIQITMEKDDMNLPEPFISYYWEKTQTEGECCGVISAAGQWRTRDVLVQSFPISCCNAKVYNCTADFAKENEVWKKGCLDYEYYYILHYACLHILGLFLQLLLLIIFDVIQRRIEFGARETIFPICVRNMFKRKRVIAPVKNTFQYYAQHTRDWDPHGRAGKSLLQETDTQSFDSNSPISTNSHLNSIPRAVNNATT